MWQNSIIIFCFLHKVAECDDWFVISQKVAENGDQFAFYPQAGRIRQSVCIFSAMWQNVMISLHFAFRFVFSPQGGRI
jgi:hypothetical protein